jgi:hypothetical protein
MSGRGSAAGRRAANVMRGAAASSLPNAKRAEIAEIMQIAAARLLPQIADWLEAGATGENADPIRAAQVALQLAEFQVPKLSRSEVGLDDPTRQALDTESRRALLAQVLSNISPAPTPTKDAK